MQQKNSAKLFVDAVEIASYAHYGQKRKDGSDYFAFHLLPLYKSFLGDHDAMTLAVLHDVVEDTTITLNYLRGWGFPEHIVEAVDAITHYKGQTLEAYCKKVKANPLARKVKIQDVAHNLTDLHKLPPKEGERLLKKYARTLSYLVED